METLHPVACLNTWKGQFVKRPRSVINGRSRKIVKDVLTLLSPLSGRLFFLAFVRIGLEEKRMSKNG